jgi:hypothetical protein
MAQYPYESVDAERTLSGYPQLIQTYLDIKPFADGGPQVVESVVEQAASTMSDPADLINVAIEHLIQQRFELPAYSTLDRLVSHVRYQVHQALYAQITATLSLPQQAWLEALLQVREGRTEFTRLKESPHRATLKHLQQWIRRLTW